MTSAKILQELEAEVVANRRAQEQRLPSVLTEVNNMIHDPVKRFPIEPSDFKPPKLQWLIRDSARN
jgi:cell fate (sporulation/competence/biofilm development) regulator YlbF (YheA/YmcA/DUF963 family)